MYICLDCGKPFDNPRLYKEKLHDDPPFEDCSVSPCCGGDFIESDKQCSICEQEIYGKYIVLATDEFVCHNCYSIEDIFDL
jgi:DNA-directed RNA polymerase subunit RPC12/RpoP